MLLQMEQSFLHALSQTIMERKPKVFSFCHIEVKYIGKSKIIDK